MSSVRVVIRFRPTNKREVKEAEEQKIPSVPIIYKHNIDGKGNDGIQIRSLEAPVPQAFAFDGVLEPEQNQEQAFEKIALPVCNDVLSGYNGTIFVYGQTGSGKTFTMFGPENDPSHPQLMGVIPRAVSYIFSTVENDENVKEARITVSFLEIYNEEVIDLLDPTKRNLKVKLQPNGETWVTNLSECEAGSLLAVLQLISDASGNRTVSATKMNATSSRSHMLMSLNLAARMTDGSARVSKLHFADLAGSEKLKKTGVTGGTQMKEAQAINLSLTTLGQVITGLSEGKKHVPYRDSKLTHVLQDSLGGNCRTTLIVNCSPHEFNREETINSLRFGMRCKLIQNKAKVNKVYSNKELMQIIKKLKAENKDLKNQLKSGGGGAAGGGSGGAEDDGDSKESGNNGNNGPKQSGNKKKKGENNGNNNRHSTAPTEAHISSLSTLLGSKVDVKLTTEYKELETKHNELNDELRQLKLSNIRNEEARVENETKIDALTKENEKNRKLLFDLETEVNDLSETKIKLESKVRLLEDTNVELKQDWKETLEQDIRKMHRTKTQANLEKFKLSDDVRALETKLDEAYALNISKDKELDRKIVKIKELLNEMEKKTLEISNLEKSKRALTQQLNELEVKCDNLNTSNTKLNEKVGKLESDIEELKIKLEKRANKLKKKNHVLAKRLSTRHDFIAQQYTLLDVANRASNTKRHTWAMNDDDNNTNDGHNNNNNNNNEKENAVHAVLNAMTASMNDLNSTTPKTARVVSPKFKFSGGGDGDGAKTPPLSAQNSIRSTSSVRSSRIAPALLLNAQRPATPSKFGKNMNAEQFNKHRASARMSRIIAADNVEELMQQDSHLLNAHDYLSGLEKKRATLTLQQSIQLQSPKKNRILHKSIDVAGLKNSQSVPTAAFMSRIEDMDNDNSNNSDSETFDDTKIETVNDIDAPTPTQDAITSETSGAATTGAEAGVGGANRKTIHAQSESDGFDLDEYGKLIDSNLAAGLEFAKFMEEEDE